MRWVLGFGSRAEMLAPAELREEIQQELDFARARYVRKEEKTERQRGKTAAGQA